LDPALSVPVLDNVLGKNDELGLAFIYEIEESLLLLLQSHLVCWSV